MKFEWGLSLKLIMARRLNFGRTFGLKKNKLKRPFPRLYNYYRDKEAMVSDCWDGEEWSINFRRSFGEEEVKEWEALLQELYRYQLGEEGDQVHWKFEKSGLYMTKSMYRLLSFEGVVSKRLQKLRKNKMPMKLKDFLWLAFQNRLETGEALKRKN